MAIVQPDRDGRDHQPVIAINNRGLTLGLDRTGAWIIWDQTESVWAAQDRLLWLLPLLERSPDEVTATIADSRASDQSLLPALLRFALTAWGRYWPGLALDWLEAGFPVTGLTDTLAVLKDSPSRPQPIQHRALRLWRAASANK